MDIPKLLGDCKDLEVQSVLGPKVWSSAVGRDTGGPIDAFNENEPKRWSEVQTRGIGVWYLIRATPVKSGEVE